MQQPCRAPVCRSLLCLTFPHCPSGSGRNLIKEPWAFIVRVLKMKVMGPGFLDQVPSLSTNARNEDSVPAIAAAWAACLCKGGSPSGSVVFQLGLSYCYRGLNNYQCYVGGSLL